MQQSKLAACMVHCCSLFRHLVVGTAEGNAALRQRRLRQLRVMLQLPTACPYMCTESPLQNRAVTTGMVSHARQDTRTASTTLIIEQTGSPVHRRLQAGGRALPGTGA